MKTLTGIDVLGIQKALNAHLPLVAYKPIKQGRMSGKTDLDIENVADRFCEVFGPNGIGWAIEPIPGSGGMAVESENRIGKEGGEQQWYVVDIFNYHLRYTLVDDTGRMIDAFSSALSDSLDMQGDKGYAIEGAMSTLIKQAYRRMGGMNHIYYGEYTHVEAQKELAAQDKGKAAPPTDPNDLTNKAVASTFFNKWKDKIAAPDMLKALSVSGLTKFTGGVSEADRLIELWILANKAEEEPAF